MNKSKLRDGRGRPLTQSLFLEIGYNTEFAVYTLKEDDYEYKGEVYISLKRLYLEMEDPTEYTFANEYLLGWSHWKRLTNNKTLIKEIEEWRFELELKIRSQAVRGIMDMSIEEKGFQAAKWLANKGWDTRGAGRPSKEDLEHETAVQERISDEYMADVVRLNK